MCVPAVLRHVKRKTGRILLQEQYLCKAHAPMFIYYRTYMSIQKILIYIIAILKANTAYTRNLRPVELNKQVSRPLMRTYQRILYILSAQQT